MKETLNQTISENECDFSKDKDIQEHSFITQKILNCSHSKKRDSGDSQYGSL